MGGELCFLDGGYLDVVGVEECREFVVAVEDTIGVELEDVECVVSGRNWVSGGGRGGRRR